MADRRMPQRNIRAILEGWESVEHLKQQILLVLMHGGKPLGPTEIGRRAGLLVEHGQPGQDFIVAGLLASLLAEGRVEHPAPGQWTLASTLPLHERKSLRSWWPFFAVLLLVAVGVALLSLSDHLLLQTLGLGILLSCTLGLLMLLACYGMGRRLR